MVALGQTLRDLLRLLYADGLPSRRTDIADRSSLKTTQEQSVRLLTRNLSPAQREQYETRGYFEVIGGDTGQRYRIREGHQMNVERIDESGRRTQLMCFVPEGRLPLGDIMLAQKIALELFESEALNVANRCWDLDFER